MKKSSRKVLWIVAVFLAIVWAYPPLTFFGDGRMLGVPIIGYWIRFRPIPFYQPGEYAFHFRGTPNDEMTLQLHVKGKSGQDEAELTQLGTTLQAVLVDQRGRVICEVGGTPKLEPGKRSDNNPNYWIWTTPDGGDAAYYHWNCSFVRLKRFDSYTLTIRIRDVDPKTPRTDLIPVLEGSHPDMT